MGETVSSLVPLKVNEIAIGKPLNRPVYDWHGKLLLASGCTIESQSQLDGLLKNGFVQADPWNFSDTRKETGDGARSAPDANGKPGAATAAIENEADKERMIALDDARWQVGEAMYLQQIDNPSARYHVKLIGFVKGRSVMVTAPIIDGKIAFIRDGQTFVIRAFSGRKAYAFTSSALKSVHTPYPYIHLSYPREVRCTTVRRGVRAQVKIIAAISLGTPEKTGAATLLDLSVGGASAIAKHPLGEKASQGIIKFKVNAAEQDEYLSLTAVLRSVIPSENGDGYRHGFEFVDVPLHERLILSAFVHQTLAEAD
ncbi:c-di-GMP-binding flagellar brake protein YcgR, contains PilZNR and PilZ domains [Noviherbaspirillum humi]|uniref:C-di-GMP-binding flagellar brake protein YcgR, contains PilZNR and PilZ domains n=1 Tax=Noviherbaspirillum humi TaxID=1688639 RepID=A0A239FPD8_9BURK|nr:flagellar brake protein [Noviherbaspirillum humi]SNS58886.1 c-di-GMP-binding flagellar brake protein YcgR, contains PilZNR and PilZ domains [Noviherbaspirillum humi]